jgi:hypothetical protein
MTCNEDRTDPGLHDRDHVLVPGMCLTVVAYGIDIFDNVMHDLLDLCLRGSGKAIALKQTKQMLQEHRCHHFFNAIPNGIKRFEREV